MILNAMSEDGERPGTELTEAFKCIFNSESAGAARKQMTYKLMKLGCEGVTVCKGAMNAFYHRDLLTSIPGEVDRLSPFSFSSAFPLTLNQSDSFTTVHLMNTMERHLTIKQIQSSMKQTVLAPNTFFELIDN
jgi:hypothetical protein